LTATVDQARGVDEKKGAQSMADMLTLLETRRSVAPHLMTGPGPTVEERDRLLRIASRVPDHGKLAPWRFILFEGEARHRAGSLIGSRFRVIRPEATEEMVAAESNRLARAPLVVAVVSKSAPHVKIPEWEQELSAGAVCMALTIAANAMGFVSAWLTEWFAYDKEILSSLGVLPEERIAGFVHIGRATEPPIDRPRPSLEDSVTTFKPQD
jgi:nitroreductase